MSGFKDRYKGSRAEEPESRPREDRLETYANTVRRSEGRKLAYVSQRTAAKLIGNHRVRHCRWTMRSLKNGVDAVEKTVIFEDKNGLKKSRKRAAYEGLQTCGNVWVCPCCSSKISRTRQDEMNEMLGWARANGHGVFMVTLTARHGRTDRLSDLLEKMKDAKQRLVRHRGYTREIKPLILGSVTATEVTAGGANGWHPHFHMIIVTKKKRADLTPLRDLWLASLEGAGLSGTGDGFDIRSAKDTGKYIAKWGAAEELALSSQKKSKNGQSRTPFQLLADTAAGDDLAKGLWLEFAHAFTIDKRRNQLVWSRGFKALVGIGEKTDEEIADEQTQDPTMLKQNLSSEQWKLVASYGRDKRAELLDMIEDVGVEAAVSAFLAGQDPGEIIEAPIKTSIERDKPSAAMSKVHEKRRERESTLEAVRRARRNSIKYQLEMNFVYDDAPPTAQVECPPHAGVSMKSSPDGPLSAQDAHGNGATGS